jgi:cellobiose-specific phosphotransferase system component IIC
MIKNIWDKIMLIMPFVLVGVIWIISNLPHWFSEEIEMSDSEKVLFAGYKQYVFCGYEGTFEEYKKQVGVAED